MSINRFQRYFAEGSLRLRPPFQRNLVWNNDQKGYLVDTVLRGLPIPEVYAHISTSANGVEIVVIVDGQQRISSFLSFLAGDLRVPNDVSYGPRWRGRKFLELEHELQQRFRSYELVVRKLPDLTDVALREIFRRLNKTVEPLTPQELRHAAFSGPFIKLVEAAGEVPSFSEIGVFSAKDYLRRRNDEFFAESAFAILSGAFPNKKDGLDEAFLTYERQGIPPTDLDSVTRRLGRVFRQLEPMASGLRRSRFRNKSDLYSLIVLLAREADRLPLGEADTNELLGRLRAFSTLVDDIKREESAGLTVEIDDRNDLSGPAIAYLRAVERAASDRLSRVRRNDALQAVLGPILARGSVTELGPQDEEWLVGATEVTDEVEDDDEVSEKAAVQALLVRSDDAALPDSAP